MTRGIVLFTALFFTALVAGGAFVIWIDYNPTGMSATFYVEKMQHAIRVFTAPLPTIVILSVLSTAASAFLARHETPWFLPAGCGESLCLGGCAHYGFRQHPHQQSDHDVERRLSAVSLDRAERAMVAISNGTDHRCSMRTGPVDTRGADSS